MPWRPALSLLRLLLLLVAVGASALASRESINRSHDNRSARTRDRHLARPAVQGCARIADETWAIDRARTAGETFPFTVWLESTGTAPCRAQVSLEARGVTLDPPGHFRSLTVSGRDGDAAWDLTPEKPGSFEVEIRSLGTAAVLGFEVRRAPLLPIPLAIRVAAGAGGLAFLLGLISWVFRRRAPQEEAAAA